MSQIFKQGQNWVIVDRLSDVSFTDEVISSVSDKDYSAYTSAKGSNSKQNYIISPKWMPSATHQTPDGWNKLKEKYEGIVQKELVYYGLMPANWRQLYACSAWTVEGNEGSWHTCHEHGPMNVCSVTYLEVPDEQEPPLGEIYFIMDANPYNPLATPEYRTLQIKPQKGMIVIFPSWLLHGVYPQGPGVRRTLNIDFNGDPNYQFNIPHAGGANYG